MSYPLRSVRIDKEGILPIRHIRIRQLLPQQRLLLLAHSLQRLLVLLVQSIVTVSQTNQHKALNCQTHHDADLASSIRGRSRRLESLSAEYVAKTEGDECEGVDGDLFGVTGEVAGVPSEEEHEGCAEGAGKVRGEEEDALVVWRARRVEANHEGGGEDGGDQADEHGEGAVVPFVAEPAGEEDEENAYGAGGGVEDESFLAAVAKGGEKDVAEV